ncbi:MAG: TIM barrel protein [Deltaproteobacteria bacterium]|nr:TIM barrel protein [Deltaproteobacteria bacterium]
MIYVSISSLSHLGLKNAIDLVCRHGIKNIELSGAFPYYDGIDKDLRTLQKFHRLNLICHNYFPHPKIPFIINLASLNDNIYQRSLSFLKEAIALSKKIESPKFGFHAGFFVDITIDEIGKTVKYKELSDQKKSIQRFTEAWDELQAESDGVELYIENNVLSFNNYKTFHHQNPLMLTTLEEYRELKKNIDFELLLDVAHLKVSAHSLGLNFIEEFQGLISQTDYVHLSDNDGFSDQNKSFNQSSDLWNLLDLADLNKKTITLEIYENINNIKNTYDLLSK